MYSDMFKSSALALFSKFFFLFCSQQLKQTINQTTMTRSTDPQKIVGNIVEAKALHVTSLAECTRRYGANKSSKMLKGVVVDTTTTTSLKTNRTSITVTAD